MSVGRYNVAQIRGDEEKIDIVANLTGLAAEDVRDRLETAHGSTRVCNTFYREWPDKPHLLADCTAAFARSYDLREEIRLATGASARLVSRRLNAAHGRKHLRNLFWDWWPEDDAEVGGDMDTGSEGDEPDDQPSFEDPAVPADGTLLSERYRLLRTLGKGGFGTTWEAYDRLSDMNLVLKIPHEEDGGAIRNELRLAFRILHPNICQAFPDRDDDTGQPFLVMEHGGQSLARILARSEGQPFSTTQAIQVLVSIADALDYLHDRLVLHLDVSPGNILVDEEDVVRLTDFGASARARAHMTSNGDRTRLADGVHSFNRSYAAPELFVGRARSRSDQYGLFLTFCSLLEGNVNEKPYYEFSPFPVLSDAQNEIIRKALSRDPEERYDSCGEPARAIADELAHVPEQVLAGDLQRIVMDFVRRVEQQQRRLGSGTTRLGGALKLGRGVERILQATFRWMGSVTGFEPLEALREVDPNASRLDRTTAGKLAKAIVARDTEQVRGRGDVARLLEDLSDTKRGLVWKVINVRNDVVHGRSPADALLEPAARMSEMLRDAFGGPEDLG